jgi:hypothetical protein
MTIEIILKKFEWMADTELDISEYIMRSDLRITGNINRKHEDMIQLADEIYILLNMMALTYNQIITSAFFRDIYRRYELKENVNEGELQILKLYNHYSKIIPKFNNYSLELSKYVHENGPIPLLKIRS